MKSWRVDGEPPPEIVDEIAAILRRGGVALLPTDTIYGLHAAVANAAAVDRIAELKGREEGKPFVVIAASPDQLTALGCVVPDVLQELWPAPVTAILARGANTLAARVPDLNWLRSLLERTGPLISTSANRAGESPATAPDQLPPAMRESVDALLDSGVLQGKPSSIVDFTGEHPRMVREGDPSFAQNLRKSLRICL
jgi:L-threonylcarbamoyladenylate synthase